MILVNYQLISANNSGGMVDMGFISPDTDACNGAISFAQGVVEFAMCTTICRTNDTHAGSW